MSIARIPTAWPAGPFTGVLVEHGYTNVRRYVGGLVDWEEAGLPIEGEWVQGR